MVGVPGKYKGCNTCRARRVKCDNQRPLCKKCVDSGRECQGYERETIFIVGTVEDKGRCSSHPPRNSRSQNDTSSSSPRQTTPVPESSSHLSPVKPLRSAWDDVVLLSKSGKTYQLRIAALYVPALAYGKTNSGGSRATLLTLPAYTPIDVQPRYGNEEFQLQAHCLASMASSSDSMLLYLFDHNSSLAYTGMPAWRNPLAEDKIRQMGPGSFTTFPAHHFFVRVYRPAAIITGLINRRPVFCGEAEWIATPWERHPKGPFDHLLDILSSIPALLQQLDHLLSLDPTAARRIMAQDLLDSALGIQAALEHWHTSLHQSVYRGQPAYWVGSGGSGGRSSSSRGGGYHHQQADAYIPFGEPVSFRDALAALAFTYYWTAQVLFYPCIGLLGHTISAPVIDEDPRQQQAGSPNNINPEAYGTDQLRTVAARLCRGLDAALAATAQPDLLAFPVRVAETFYGGISVITQSGDGAMELIWLAAFKDRIMGRGQDLAGLVMSKEWKDLADW